MRELEHLATKAKLASIVRRVPTNSLQSVNPKRVIERQAICYARSRMKLPNGERAIVDRRKLEE